MRNFKGRDIGLFQEETSRNNWPKVTTISIHKGCNGFIWGINREVDKNAPEKHETQIAERPVNKLVLLLESEEEYSNKQWNTAQDEISLGEECVDGKFFE